MKPHLSSRPLLAVAASAALAFAAAPSAVRAQQPTATPGSTESDVFDVIKKGGRQAPETGQGGEGTRAQGQAARRTRERPPQEDDRTGDETRQAAGGHRPPAQGNGEARKPPSPCPPPPAPSCAARRGRSRQAGGSAAGDRTAGQAVAERAVGCEAAGCSKGGLPLRGNPIFARAAGIFRWISPFQKIWDCLGEATLPWDKRLWRSPISYER